MGAGSTPKEAAAVVLGLLDGLSLQLTFDRGLMTLPRAARLVETVLARYLSPGDPTWPCPPSR